MIFLFHVMYPFLEDAAMKKTGGHFQDISRLYHIDEEEKREEMPKRSGRPEVFPQVISSLLWENMYKCGRMSEEPFFFL